MISLQVFANEFNHRHDFNSESLKKLNENFPNTRVHNIPDAWIPLIDFLLRRAYSKHPMLVKEVTQHFGFLCLSYRSMEVPLTFQAHLRDVEYQLYLIDMDLHILLDYDRKAA